MTFSGIHLYYAINEIKPLIPAYLQKIKQLKKGQWVFTFKGKQKFSVYISIHSQDARMHRTFQSFDYSEALDNFSVRMKKWLLNSTLTDLSQPLLDRTVKLTFNGKDELFNPTTYALMAEFFGKDANLIITDGNDKIMDLYKTSGPLHESKRLLQIGASYTYLPTDKKSPFDEGAVKDYFTREERPPLNHVFNGFSKNVASELSDQIFTKEAWFHTLNHPHFHIEHGRDYLFHHSDSGMTFTEFADQLLIQTLLQRPYDTTKSKALKALNSRLKKARKKIDILTTQLHETKESEVFSEQGKLIMQHPNKHEKKAMIEVFDYTENQLKRIPLDIKYSVLDNANMWFKKAKKMKASIPHLKKQLRLTRQDIAYYELLMMQLHDADEISLQEIYLELVKEHIIRVKSASLIKKKATYKTFISSDDIDILVGMNNNQNNTLTHTIARKDDSFCHVKDYPGSHVIIRASHPPKKTIEEACMLAAYYSKAKGSPKIDVDVVLIKHVKKIPGKYGCFVRYDTHQSYTVEAKLPSIFEKK